MIVNVTQYDIDHGMRNSCYECPIARAIHRELTEDEYPQVTTWSITIRSEQDSTYWEEYNTTPAMREFMFRFDHRQPVEPFRFALTRTKR